MGQVWPAERNQRGGGQYEAGHAGRDQGAGGRSLLQVEEEAAARRRHVVEAAVSHSGRCIFYVKIVYHYHI